MTTRFTQDHEWAKMDGDDIIIGITDFAQQQLGEVVFVELPDVDSSVSQGDESAVVESVKAAGEVKSPISGTVVAINDALEDAPETVNSAPEADGWLYKVKASDSSEFDTLMDQAAYDAFLATL